MRYVGSHIVGPNMSCVTLLGHVPGWVLKFGSHIVGPLGFHIVGPMLFHGSGATLQCQKCQELPIEVCRLYKAY